MLEREWEPVTGTKLAGFAIGLGLFLLLLFSCEPGFVLLLDHANLLFHEAGHPIVGLFSSRLEPYGGTLGQLVFPCALAVSCWRAGQTFGVAIAVTWFFENWLNVARYMADARRLELPLVGGGDHDWNTIFNRWGVLQQDVQIASGVKLVAWSGIILACAWLIWHWWRDRKRAIHGGVIACSTRPF
ncbi:MAG TPA: hypothetical protein VN578_09205 [Candidatus Binatia bacterium]|jgi:hypothetical protein|nr:hypothetical protein [Candidatus Binatia bacterium]